MPVLLVSLSCVLQHTIMLLYRRISHMEFKLDDDKFPWKSEILNRFVDTYTNSSVNFQLSSNRVRIKFFREFDSHSTGKLSHIKKSSFKVVLAWDREFKLPSSWNFSWLTSVHYYSCVKCNEESDISLVLWLFRKKLSMNIWI